MQADRISSLPAEDYYFEEPASECYDGIQPLKEFPCYYLKDVLPNKSKEFILSTMPKTGTHLLQPLLTKITGKASVWAGDIFPRGYVKDQSLRNLMFSGDVNVPLHWFCVPVPKTTFIKKLYELQNNWKYFSAHAPYSKDLESVIKARKGVVFFVLRDPRDFVISLWNHLNKFDNDFIDQEWWYALPKDQQITHLIIGTDWFNSASTIVKEFIAWRHSPICCTLRYEQLMGPSGGKFGIAEQKIELQKIPRALNIHLDDATLLQYFKEVHGQGYTFNGGRVGRWKDHFTEEHKTLFKQVLGNELIELGYENDFNW